MTGRFVISILCILFWISSLNAQSLTCTAQASATAAGRAEGNYEGAGDIVVQCLNGSLAAGLRYAGVEVTTVPDTISFTSRTLNSASAITEALLLVGDPQPAGQSVCQTPLDPAACAGANVFPGIRVSASKLRFVIPFTDPGAGSSRLLRIVNLRAALSQFGLAEGVSQDMKFLVAGVSTGAPAPQVALPVSATITAAVARRSIAGAATSGTSAYSCTDVNRELALSSSAPSTTDGRNFGIRITESAFPSAFRRRNVAAPFFGEPTPPLAQSTPGVAYVTETGFYNPSFPGIYADAGLPATASRFFLRVHNVPGGVKLFAPTVLSLVTRNQTTNALTVTGSAKRMIAGSDGAGNYSRLPATTPIGGGLAQLDALGAFHQAVYEIVDTDTTAIEEINVPVYPALLVSTGATGALTASVGWAPVSADVTGDSLITPRFQNFSQPFAVAQIEGCLNLSIAPQAAAIPAAGASGSLTVTASSVTAWTAVANASWITVTAGAAGQGNGTVSYTVAANPDPAVRTSTITIGTATFTVTQDGTATGGSDIVLNPTQQTWTAGIANGSFTVTTTSAWTAVSFVNWIVVTSTSNNQVQYTVAVNPNAGQRTGTISVGSAVFTVIQTGTAGGGSSSGTNMLFVPVTPCRVADTRENLGQFGLPVLAAGAERSFPIPAGPCGIPTNSRAYALNLTVVPRGQIGYLTIWPSGQTQPFVSTLNSVDGRIKANAAIVPAGTNGAVSVFSTGATDLVIDINGYFIDDPQFGTAALVFYPLAPCRVLDTRNATGALGGPILAAGSSRSFPVQSSVCGVPSTAQAYSLNATVVPTAGLGYLTLWPTGLTQPFVSTLNSLNGAIVANAAIVPAGTGGAISAFVYNETHLVIDINGYFAPPGSPGALRFNTVTPCRVLDSRGPSGSLGGPVLAAGQTRSWPVPSSACALPSTAGAYSMNATVVPTAGLGYLTMFPTGQGQPFVSTLNAVEDRIVANALLIPAGTAGAISSFVSSETHLILDVNGYFAQ